MLLAGQQSIHLLLLLLPVLLDLGADGCWRLGGQQNRTQQRDAVIGWMNSASRGLRDQLQTTKQYLQTPGQTAVLPPPFVR